MMNESKFAVSKVARFAVVLALAMLTLLMGAEKSAHAETAWDWQHNVKTVTGNVDYKYTAKSTTDRTYSKIDRTVHWNVDLEKCSICGWPQIYWWETPQNTATITVNDEFNSDTSRPDLCGVHTRVTGTTTVKFDGYVEARPKDGLGWRSSPDGQTHPPGAHYYLRGEPFYYDPAEYVMFKEEDLNCGGTKEVYYSRLIASSTIAEVIQPLPTTSGYSLAGHYSEPTEGGTFSMDWDVTGHGECASGPVKLSFGPKALKSYLTSYSRDVISDILKKACMNSATITSTYRTAAEQARVMYENLEKHGVKQQKKLYGPAGDHVIDVYVASKKKGKSPADIKQDMEDKINKEGPCKVSHHSCDPKKDKLNTIDIAPSSIKNKKAFIKEVKADKRVSKFLQPPKDPAYHIEIPQKKK